MLWNLKFKTVWIRKRNKLYKMEPSYRLQCQIMIKRSDYLHKKNVKLKSILNPQSDVSVTGICPEVGRWRLL